MRRRETGGGRTVFRGPLGKGVLGVLRGDVEDVPDEGHGRRAWGEPGAGAGGEEEGEEGEGDEGEDGGEGHGEREEDGGLNKGARARQLSGQPGPAPQRITALTYLINMQTQIVILY